MRNRSLHHKDFISFVLVLIPLVLLGVPASAQSVSGQSNVRIQDNDTTRIELAHFDQFMDSHREIAEQLRKDPSLVNNREFVEKHPALQTYLQEHPGVREEIKENPNAFMRQENRFDRQEDRRQGERDSDTTRAQLARFDQFMDRHREIAEQLRKDPSLVNNREFVEKHPALQTYLQEHPGVREEIKENPNAFMRQENRFDRQEDRRQSERDSDTTRGQLAHFEPIHGQPSRNSRATSQGPFTGKQQGICGEAPCAANVFAGAPGNSRGNKGKSECLHAAGESL